MAAEERRQISVPINLTVKDRTVEIPLAVEVSLAELCRLVQQHLDTGDDLTSALLELYADRMAPTAPPPAAKRQAEPAGADFTAEELEAARGAEAPPYSGKGKKSRARRVWEAANG
jgi:hypothetical protein